MRRHFYYKMRALSSKNVCQCHLGVCSRCPTFLRHLSLIALAHQIWTFILLLGTIRPFGGIQTPRQLSITISGRALATSREWSLMSLFFLSLALEPSSCLSLELNSTRRSTKLLSAIFLSALVLTSSTWLWHQLEKNSSRSIANTSITSSITFAR